MQLMLTVLLDIVAVGLLALGSIVMAIRVYGVLRMPDVYSQTLPGVVLCCRQRG